MRELLRRAIYLLRRHRLEDELDEELAFHRERTRQALEEAGTSPERAAIEGQHVLGNDALARNRARDVWVWPWLQDISQDVRFAARLLAKDRRFTLAAVVALALGIGVTNTVFTIVNTASIRDLPFDEPHRLISVATRHPAGREAESHLDFRDIRAAATTFSDLAASVTASFNLGDEHRVPDRLLGAFVSASTFRILRVQPILGRDFLPEDDRPGAPAAAIISYAVWQVRYGGDPAVIGQPVRINGAPATIVGVMPRHFWIPRVSRRMAAACAHARPRDNEARHTQADGLRAAQQLGGSRARALGNRVDCRATHTGVSRHQQGGRRFGRAARKQAA